MAPTMALGTPHAPIGIRVLEYFSNPCGFNLIPSFNPLFSSRNRYSISKTGSNALVDGRSTTLSLEKENKEEKLIGFEGNARVVSEREGEGKDKELKVESGVRGLELLEDDLSWEVQSVKDFFDRSKEFTRPDGGPPRWFTPIECGCPMKDSPVLLFLPGMDGTGLGLILHHQALGRIFDVRCMHIPIYDRTPFEGLVKFVEDTVRLEHALSPDRPIYLLGDSLGGCLALAVAARNPAIDLVLILSNPATSFGKSQLQPLLPLIEAVPAELHSAIPYLLSTIMGDPVKMAMVDVPEGLSPPEMVDQLSGSLVALLPCLSALSEIIPKGTLAWKLKLLKSASSYANSRLHAVKAEVLVLASGKDQMLPSMEEAERLRHTLPNCRVRFFKDGGHAVLLEDGINLLTVINGAQVYRRSRIRDFLSDFLPPTLSEFKKVYEQQNGWFHQAVNPVMLSTMEDGTIVKGLAGFPDEGPVLFVGYHMLMGLELSPLVGEILREKKILLRGLAHPLLFSKRSESSTQDPSSFDAIRNFGGVPVSPSNIFKLLSRKAHVLLYPGGVREALHRKGEEYQLFWPERSEFVRMAAKFGATIVPFGVVGEDDIVELVVDYNDLMSFPPARDFIKQGNKEHVRLRTDVTGELANQDMYCPGLLPKIPGRFYYLFGKPIETRERKAELRDKEEAHKLYVYIKSEVENIMSFLRKKREEDPYRSLLPRALYQATWGFTKEVPTFEL
ncbi:hypothetical protein AMTRI_Chr02g264470 [Amborella trichopoda]|uniref:Serine aminopeptidase S33 domain-containing protein n=1 Tax=Amborella trichopoda TaxID=13333 RepID=U5D377_AMBTC|nr:acyltransferase-like protein At1g54570, chloroplastic [Amborella trichopoda]XP_020529825.1 acyltransferase-like protein At1g54570, chloroplastic [Amborella trichopoda]XP_020529826.1 acyltransferase-like protein At1g54570, chloroplastic [Amborella trichopoda]ERN16884.1 hypothetical protein AMTR_s00057p00160950 [Amborella trichopoda]|eukprot:XP_011627415.1 acyltransferase-like protein At1g54570, chloroplastic [Amborella trichopoda]